MKTHNIPQGVPEWHAHRRAHRNASDASAMMGESPYKTRTELLHEVHTGLAADVDPHTQARFDDGHRFEALARPLAEKIIGEDLFPVVGTLGNLSASFDGLTMSRQEGFEHKSLNDTLRAAFDSIETIAPEYRDGPAGGRELPIYYQIQMEQQLLVSGAERILFMASKWEGESLVEERHCWYYSNPTLRDDIINGWQQFERDLAAYVPAPVEEKKVAEAIERLPALSIQIKGEVVLSNLPRFQEAAEAYIDGINTELQTDQDFADAKANVKFCDETEKAIETAIAAALAQTSSIDDLMRTMNHLKERLRVKRLTLDRLVTKRETEIKQEIVAEARADFQAHLAGLDLEIKPIRVTIAEPDWQAAIKNKRTLASLRDSVNTALANGKIAADAMARDFRAKLAWCKETVPDHGFLFPDMQGLIGKARDDFELTVRSRVQAHKDAEAKKAEQLAAIAKTQQDEIIKIHSMPVDIAGQAIEQATAVNTAVSSTNVVPMGTRAPVDTPPTLAVGKISERLGFMVTAAFLRTLGFEPTQVKAASLYRESEFPRICEAIVEHINKVRTQRMAA